MPIYDAKNNPIYNCPNCAAPIGYSDKCPYCGTVLRWMPFLSIDTIYLNAQPVDTTALIDPYMIEKGYVTDDRIFADLAQQMTRELAKHMEFRKEDYDYRSGRVRYRARLWVADKK